MKKKIISILFICVFLIMSTTNFVFAETTSTTTLGNTSFPRDTVITHENLNDILKHYGLDPSTARSDLPKPKKEVITVGDLEDVINLSKQLDKTIVTNKDFVDNNDNNGSAITNITGEVGILKDGTQTIIDPVTLGDVILTKYVTGYFHSYGEERWWTGAAGASLSPASASGSYTYAITKSRQLSNVCYNPNKSSSYLQLKYDVDITRYFYVLGVLISTTTSPYSGTSNYNTSHIPAY